MTQPTSNNTYSVATGTNSNSVFINFITTRNPTPQDINYPIQKRWINTISQQEYILLNFITSNGVVTANWVLLNSASGAGVQTVEGNTGGFVGPTAGNLDIVGDGTTIEIAGDQATSTMTVSVILPGTEHELLVNESTFIGSIPNVSSSGIPLVSKGIAADPAFDTAEVIGGGTGKTSFIPFTPVVGGSSSTSFLQSVPSPGLSGEVLTSNGTGNLPTFKPVGSTGGFVWSDQSGSFSGAAGNGYLITASATCALPLAPSNGEAIAFIVDTTDHLTIQVGTGQFIRIGSGISSATGTAISTAQGDALTIVYHTATTSWLAFAVSSVWTLS